MYQELRFEVKPEGKTRSDPRVGSIVIQVVIDERTHGLNSHDE